MIIWIVMVHMVGGPYLYERSDFPMTGNPATVCQAEMKDAIDRMTMRPQYQNEKINGICVNRTDYEPSGKWMFGANYLVRGDGNAADPTTYYTRTYPEGK